MAHPDVGLSVQGPRSARATSPSRIASITPYLSHSLVRRRLHGPAESAVLGDVVEGTLLLADISGFTAFSEQLSRSGHEGAEQLTTVLNDYFERMIEIIAGHGGDVLQFGGDSILVLFAATGSEPAGLRQAGPSREAREAIAAIQCGLSMQAAMKPFERLETQCGVFPLTMRIAIHRGPFLLGGAASRGQHLQQIFFGASLNRLADVERLAQAGGVLVTPEVSAVVGEHIPLSADREGLFRVVSGGGDGSSPPLPPESALGEWLRIDPFDPDAAEQKLSAYLIPAVYRRIVEDPTGSDPDGEHRHIVTMFVHFTGIDARVVERDDPREVVRVLDEYLAHMSEIIEQHGGTLARVSPEIDGDKLLVLFGAPVAVEQPEQNALACALEMNRCVESLNQRLPVKMAQRIGITAGNAFCGNVGCERRREYTVMGHHVNAAKRLMSAAAAGEILVSPPTWKQARRHFLFRPREPLKLKGIEQPMKVYQLVAGRESRLPTARSHLPFVGRESELARLRTLVTRVREGFGQVVALIGDAGVGKTRLVEELIGHCQAREFRCFAGQCDAQGSSTPYHAWGAVFRELCHAGPTPTSDACLPHLESALAEARPDLLDFAPVLGPILGIDLPDNDRTRPLTPRHRKEKVLDICVELLRAQARSHPLLIVLEDLQWGDSLSRELLLYLNERIEPERILVVAVHRTEYRLPAWEASGHQHEILLMPFDPAATVGLLQELLGVQEVPEELVRGVQERTQGNPLFVEELVHVLVDTGQLKRDGETQQYQFHPSATAAVPGSVQTLILSRVDRLNEERRQIIQVASVFGRSFRRDTLHAALQPHLTPQRLDSTLQKMTELSLIQPQDSAAGGSYVFRHALVQEAIYESISFARRRDLHRSIGEVLQHRYDEPSAHCEELARHFDLGMSSAWAVEYLVAAGDKARAVAANADAAGYYEKALTHLRRLPDADIAVLCQLLEKLGDVHSLNGNYTAATGRYTECLRRVSDPIRLAHLEGKFGGVAYRQGQPQLGIEHLDKGLAHLGIAVPRTRWQIRWSLAKQMVIQAAHTFFPRLAIRPSINPPATRAAIEIYESLSRICYESDLERTLDCHLRQLNLCETVPDSVEMAQTYSSHGIVCGAIPLFKRGLRYQQRGLEIRERKRDRWGVAQSCNFMGITYYWTGRYEQAIQCLEKSAEIFRDVGDRWESQVTYLILAYAYTRRGEFSKAIHYGKICLDLSRRAEDSQGIGWALGALADLYVRQGQLDTALTTAHQAIEYSQQAHDQMYLAFLRKVLGDIQLRRGNARQAVEEMTAAVELIQRHRLRHEYVLGAYSGLAEALLAEALSAAPRSDAPVTPAHDAKRPVLNARTLRTMRHWARRGIRKATRYRNWLPYAHRVAGQIESAAGRPGPARHHLERSIQMAKLLGSEYDLGMAYTEYGQWLIRQGDPTGQMFVDESHRILTRCQATTEWHRGQVLRMDRPANAIPPPHLPRNP